MEKDGKTTRVIPQSVSLEEHPLFTVLSFRAKEKILSAAKEKLYAEGATVFVEGAPPDAIYLVLSGEISLVKQAEGRNEIIARVKPADYFGEVGVLDGSGRSTGAVASRETRLVEIPAGPFVEVLRKEPADVCLVIFSRVLERLREINQRYMEERLRKERLYLLGEMADSIVHDLRSPITGIQLAADLITTQHEDPNTARWCRVISQQSNRMVTMVHELLDYSRGETDLKKEIISVKHLLEEFDFLHADFLRRAQVEFVWQGIEDSVEVDVSRFLRVLENLVINAVEANTAKGARVEIRSGVTPDRRVEILVKDNGPGIPEAIRETLFEPFVTHGKRKGIGLGMAISRKVVEAHGGKISFISSAEQGTTFLIHLPLALQTNPSL
jgi:signal transduction histidine kinase